MKVGIKCMMNILFKIPTDWLQLDFLLIEKVFIEVSNILDIPCYKR